MEPVASENFETPEVQCHVQTIVLDQRFQRCQHSRHKALLVARHVLRSQLIVMVLTFRCSRTATNVERNLLSKMSLSCEGQDPAGDESLVEVEALNCFVHFTSH